MTIRYRLLTGCVYDRDYDILVETICLYLQKNKREYFLRQFSRRVKPVRNGWAIGKWQDDGHTTEYKTSDGEEVSIINDDVKRFLRGSEFEPVFSTENRLSVWNRR